MTDRLNTRGVLCSTSFMPSWVRPVSADPRASAAEMRERAELGRTLHDQARHEIEVQGSPIYQVVRDLNERFGTPFYTPRRGSAAGPPYWGAWSWKEATVMIATSLGAPEPPWDEATHSWWFNKNHGLFDWVQTPADVAKIPVPDWPNTPQVCAMLEAQARWREAFPGDPAPFDQLYPLNISGNRWMVAAGYPSFIDTGICLLGIANFLAVLAGDRPLADALEDKCFELVTSYGDFLLSRAGLEIEGWMGFGGDVSAMLSPRLYERYGNGFDVRLFDYVKKTYGTDDAALWNLHSCGPSSHLYDVWARHPHRLSIAVMQTRLIPGQVARLRAALPATHLDLTVHPGHFDFASAAPEAVRQMIRQTIMDARHREVAIHIFAVAHAASDLPRLVENLRACYQTMKALEGTTSKNASIPMPT
jgi:hypothetical protein